MKCSICKSELKQTNEGCKLFEERYECSNEKCFANQQTEDIVDDRWYWNVFGEMHCNDIIVDSLPTNLLLKRILVDGESSAFESIRREEIDEEHS